MKRKAISMLVSMALPFVAHAADTEYSPYVDADYPMNVYFGDTHIHTIMSADTGLAGGTISPEETYRVARGEVATGQSGHKFRLIRPLDFVVIADHAENLGIAEFMRTGDPIILENEVGKRWYDMNQEGRGYEAYIEWLRDDNDQINEPEMARKAWQYMIDAAEEYNEPGKFTAFHGFEWTSMPQGRNMHRVVIFRDGEDKASQVLPFSAFDSEDPEALWEYLADYEEKTGGSVMAIPHNGNLSNGLMFSPTDFEGEPLSREYAEMRMRFEKLVEVTQMKGDGETHPFLSPDDEFADFETIDASEMKGIVAKEDWMLAQEYARSALKMGLEIEQEIGANPFKFGMIGSTDTHNGFPSSRQENFFHKGVFWEPGMPQRKDGMLVQGVNEELSMFSKDMAAAGLAAVWAEENTREAIFDAMARKETYATTGTRLKVRVFAGWDFAADDIYTPNLADIGYRNGVPMGGDLTQAPEGKAPNFLIQAIRDQEGANLDRIQVIKGWVDAEGQSHERIFDVATSGDRQADETGRVKEAVGSTVDVKTATYNNSIGAPQLMAHWQDPEFDPALNAFYYVRVLEIPQPRWHVYDDVKYGAGLHDDMPTETQERAYTSPIWYSPSK
ncbi:DUF3604 domain-containing protein [Vibrio sp. WXL210]|uniref:DUF3604 domain-containing protein n=1 Tax=Vibrio sp. WXL210 TaxID=3450709 RepID=UPI003EC4B339